MSEAVSSNHDPDLRLPKAAKTKKTPIEPDVSPQQNDHAAADESLHGAIRETIPLEIADWQPVEFPGALSLAELSRPVQSVGKAESWASSPKDSSFADNQANGDLVRQLQQENLAFRTQLSQLERDLAQAQVELQLEVARFYCKEPEVTAVPQSASLAGMAAQAPLNAEERTAMHQQINQLAQELDSSQKMGQRQQILVETLNEQLESSQERIAHLERDCAITQQRHNEQVQLVLQAENVCRDLRMRLHRQQRQALQFKAALERSLEMEAVQGVAIAQSDPMLSCPADATPFIPKVQPVQPWSQETATDSRTHANCRGEEQGLLNLFSKLLMADQPPVEGVEITPIQEVELASIQEPPIVNQREPQGQAAESDRGATRLRNPLPLPEVITPEDVFHSMGIIFPKRDDFLAQSPAVMPVGEEAVFDLSPFLEAGDADTLNAPAIELRPIAKNILPPLLHPPRPQKSAAPEKPPVETTLPPQVVSQSGDPENNLWADLAKLVEPDLTVESGSTPDLSGQSVERSPIAPNPFQGADSLADEAINPKKTAQKNQSDRPASTKTPSLDFFAYIEKKTTSPQNTEASGSAPPSEPNSRSNLSHFEKKKALSEATLERTPSLPKTSDDSLNACPSPILYPCRSAKKLASMSAVDLPSFRHAAT